MEPLDCPCFTAPCRVHMAEGNGPRRWPGAGVLLCVPGPVVPPPPRAPAHGRSYIIAPAPLHRARMPRGLKACRDMRGTSSKAVCRGYLCRQISSTNVRLRRTQTAAVARLIPRLPVRLCTNAPGSGTALVFNSTRPLGCSKALGCSGAATSTGFVLTPVQRAALCQHCRMQRIWKERQPSGLFHPIYEPLEWAGFRLRRGAVDTVLWLDPRPKKGSIDWPPKILPRLIPGPGVDPDPKFGQKWDFWNQRVEGVQKRHHLPCIGWKENLTIFNAQKKFGA